MSSFYGGKQGRTYNIVQRYDSVAQMLEAFSQGGAYTRANYGQYVIIDTVLNLNRKDDPENGLLYRRGFDYNDRISDYPKPNKNDKDQNDNYKYKDANGNLIEQQWQKVWTNWVVHPGAGAIYVGQIVGPEGESPDFTPVTWQVLQTLEEEGRQIKRVIPVSKTKGNNSSTVCDGEGRQLFFDQQEEQPVWYGDLIKVGTLTQRDEQDNINEIKLAFDIPQNVFEPKIVQHSPYSISKVEQNPSSTVHPFYYRWDFTIPDGKHGRDFTELKVETGEQIAIIDGTDAFGDSIQNNDFYFTYTTTDYEDGTVEEGPIPHPIQHQGIWPYRVIQDIFPILKQRTVINWEENYTDQIGDLYRTDNYYPEMYWLCIKSGKISIDNKLSEIKEVENQHSTPESWLGLEQGSDLSLWRAVRIPEVAPMHSLNVDYKAGPSSTVSGIRSVDYLTVNQDGKIYVIYSDSNIPYYLTTVKTIEYLRYQDDTEDKLNYGKVMLKYFGQEEKTLYDPKVIDQIKFKNQEDLENPDGQYFSVKIASEESQTKISDRFNYIVASTRVGDNLLFLYSDPSFRSNIPSDKKVIIPQWTDPIHTNAGQPITYENLQWYDFGALGAQYHTQGIYTYEDLKTWLSHGFRNFNEDPLYSIHGNLSDRMGWLVTVKDTDIDPNTGEDIDIYRIYAYDYNDSDQNGSYTIDTDRTPTHWYEIMSLGEQMINPNRFITLSDEEPTSLKDNGLWFVISYGHADEDL